MTVQFRFVEDGDYDREAVVRIAQAIEPDSYLTAADLEDIDKRRQRAGRPGGRWMASVGGVVMGYASFVQNPWLPPGLFHISVKAHPDHQRHGHGRSLLERIETSARDHDGVRLIAHAKEIDERSNRFAERAGFEEIDRWWRSTLDLRGFEPGLWTGVIEDVLAQGVRLVTVDHLQATNPRWEKGLHDLYVAIEQDVPEALPIVEVPFEDFVARSLGRDMLADGFLVAMDGDTMIGLTEPQSVDADPSAVSQDLTGVRASHRRRGIAVALKAAAATWAKEKGYASIRTYNAQSNAPMLGVNERLGFVRDLGSVEYAKDL